MTLAEASQALGVQISSDPAYGSEECAIAFIGRGEYSDLLFMVENGRITRISLDAPRPDDARMMSRIVTQEGVGLGATDADVRAAYGDALGRTVAAYVGEPAHDLYVWRSAERGLRFEMTGSGHVHAIHGGSRSIEYKEGCL